MANRLSQRAQKAITNAREFALSSNHGSSVPAHLLYALANLGEGLGWNLLASLSIDTGLIRERVLQEMPQSNSLARREDISFSPDSNQVLDEAATIAASMDCDYVGTEHILLGLCRSDNQLAVAILLEVGATEGEVRKAILDVTGSTAPPKPLGAHGAADKKTSGRPLSPMANCPSILGFASTLFADKTGTETEGILVFVRSGFDAQTAHWELLKAIPDLAATPLRFKLPGERPVARILGEWEAIEWESETFAY